MLKVFRSSTERHEDVMDENWILNETTYLFSIESDFDLEGKDKCPEIEEPIYEVE